MLELDCEVKSRKVKRLKLLSIHMVICMALLIFLSACSSYSLKTFHQIEVGMRKSDVLDKLGSPFQTQYRNDIYYWLYRFFQDGSWIYKEIQLKNNRVVYVGDFMTPLQRERYEYRSPTDNLRKLERELRN